MGNSSAINKYYILMQCILAKFYKKKKNIYKIINNCGQSALGTGTKQLVARALHLYLRNGIYQALSSSLTMRASSNCRSGGFVLRGLTAEGYRYNNYLFQSPLPTCRQYRVNT